MYLLKFQAVDEPGFSVAYARMCEVLQKKQVKMKKVNKTYFKWSK